MIINMINNTHKLHLIHKEYHFSEWVDEIEGRTNWIWFSFHKWVEKLLNDSYLPYIQYAPAGLQCFQYQLSTNSLSFLPHICKSRWEKNIRNKNKNKQKLPVNPG